MINTKLFMIIALAICSFLTVSSVESKATGNKVAPITNIRTVNITTDVYAQLDEKSDVIGTLYTWNAVQVMQQYPNQWTKIRFGNTIGYVYSPALKQAKPSTKQTYAKNISKRYEYNFYIGDEQPQSIIFQFNPKRVHAQWDYNALPYTIGNWEIETSKGLYIGDDLSGKLYLALPYPIKKNQKFRSLYHAKAEVISTKATVQTPRKVYKNVVVVKSNQLLYYYAKNEGLIQLRSSKQTVLELAKTKAITAKK